MVCVWKCGLVPRAKGQGCGPWSSFRGSLTDRFSKWPLLKSDKPALPPRVPPAEMSQSLEETPKCPHWAENPWGEGWLCRAGPGAFQRLVRFLGLSLASLLPRKA